MSRLFGQEWGKISLYLVLALVCGALLAPWLYHGGKETVRQGWLATPATEYLHGALDRAKFPRYFNRAVLIAAVLGMIPLVRSLRFRGWNDLQLHRNRCATMDALAGVLLGAGFLLFMGAAFLYMKLFRPETAPEVGKIPLYALSGVVVGLLEEVFFRGAMLGVLMRKMRVWAAVILTSVVYAIVHFLKPPRDLNLESIEWHSGFTMLGHAFARLAHAPSFLAEFSTLVVVGIVLAIVRLRTRSLWLPIGLHAGWVFGLKVFSEYTNRTALLKEWSPWVGSDLKTGLIPLGVIFITGAFASLWIDLSRKPILSQEQDSES